MKSIEVFAGLFQMKSIEVFAGRLGKFSKKLFKSTV